MTDRVHFLQLKRKTKGNYQAGNRRENQKKQGVKHHNHNIHLKYDLFLDG